MGNELSWQERVLMLSINPDAATRDDVAKLATELMQAKRVLRLKNKAIEEIEVIIHKVLLLWPERADNG